MSSLPRRERKAIAIDETKLKIGGKRVFICAVTDTDTREHPWLSARFLQIIHQYSGLPEEGDGYMHQRTRRSRGRRALVTVGTCTGDVRPVVAPH